MSATDVSTGIKIKKSIAEWEERVDPPNYDPAITELDKAIELAKKSGADPELVETLQRTSQLVRLREEFTLFCTSQDSETCKEIYERTISHDWRKAFDERKTTWNLTPGMMSGPLEGQFLKTIVSLQKAKRILDIGMFSGYSALSLAEALPDDGEIVTIDQDEYLKTFVQDVTKSSPHRNKIKYLIGNALDLLAKMVENGEKFDIFFLDADKTEYVDYFKFAFEKNLLNPGGTVLVDNTYFFGEGYSDKQTCAKTFAQTVVANKSLHSVLVPIRDGIMIIRRMSDVEGSIPGN